MAKDAQEIRVVKVGEGVEVSVKADLTTSLAMVVATVMAISEKSAMDTKAIYKMLSGVTEEVKKDGGGDFSKSELTKLVGPVSMWMEENMPPFATIVIDSEGATVLKTSAKIVKKRKEGKETKCQTKKKTA